MSETSIGVAGAGRTGATIWERAGADSAAHRRNGPTTTCAAIDTPANVMNGHRVRRDEDIGTRSPEYKRPVGSRQPTHDYRWRIRHLAETSRTHSRHRMRCSRWP